MNSTSAVVHALDTILLPLGTPLYYSTRPSVLPGISDRVLALIVPIIAYWVPSLFFHLLDTYSTSPPFSWLNVEQYRIHDSAETKAKNRATPEEVFRAIIVQQVVQTALGYWWLSDENPSSEPTLVADHVREMRKMAPQVAWFCQILLGEVTAANFLRRHGGKLVYLVYWWALPIMQFLLSL